MKDLLINQNQPFNNDYSQANNIKVSLVSLSDTKSASLSKSPYKVNCQSNK